MLEEMGRMMRREVSKKVIAGRCLLVDRFLLQATASDPVLETRALLSSKIEEYAREAVRDLRNRGYSDQEIRETIRETFDEEESIRSEILEIYRDFFQEDDETLHKFHLEMENLLRS